MIVPMLRQFEPQYVNDAYAQTLAEAFERLTANYQAIGTNARIVAESFIGEANTANKQRFYNAMNEATGIDLQNLIQNEDLQDVLIASTRENVALIKSIPDEYFKKIEGIVFRGTMQGNSATSMIKQIQEVGKTSAKRAKLIARDQSSKLNSALNQQRQQNLGVEEYIWRTAEDGRVRDTHRDNNGKVFRWDDPPAATGHPGEDIQCRCVAQPIIKL